jgi:hypothetical protein
VENRRIECMFVYRGLVMIAPSDYTPADVLARAEWAVQDRRAAMVEELDLALCWADLHSTAPEIEVAGGERLVALGGEGTPLVRDLSLAELAIARGEHLYATRSLLADLLDLRHRLPRLWGHVQSLGAEPWVARKIASLSRALSPGAAAVVDAAVAAAVGQSPGRLLAIAEAKIIEGDTEARRAELEQARELTGVWLTSTREEAPGLRSVYARLEAGDAVWVDATVQRVADLLATDPDLRTAHHPDLGERPTRDALRAAAFGWLARPHDLAELLGHIEQTDQQRKQRRQSAVVYVHLHQAALEGAPAVARVPGLGPLLLEQVASLVGHADITLKPVIDLNIGSSINGYEHPHAVKGRTLLRTVGTVFPHATGATRRVDHDHPVPYDPLGPPGQTGDHNDAPLDQRAHRAKTHLGYTVEQLALGVYLWTTPEGLTRLVNHTGTHRINPEDLDLIRRIHAA